MLLISSAATDRGFCSKYRDKQAGVVMIKNYDDFVRELLMAGFSLAGGGNDEGVFELIKHGWNEDPKDSPLRWHTGNPETNPWEWRMRVLDERDDIAYAKVFFKKTGYITKEWYPYFLAARRGEYAVFDDEYYDGKVSHFAKRIYDVVSQNESLPVHIIKQLAGFTREEKSAFDRALTELQMKMYITMCGCQQKNTQMGIEYGWSSTVFCTTEKFFGNDVFEQAAKIDEDEAAEKITERVFLLNPSAQEKKIIQFIKG